MTLLTELNGLFNLGLDTDPSLDRLCNNDGGSVPVRFLMVGGSHALKEGEVIADRGFAVTTCAIGGWRPNRGAVDEMAAKVETALSEMKSSDVIVVHCFDNVAFMGRSEEAGDLPIRRYPNGEFHVEGDIVTASKERLHMYFRNCLPVLRLLEGRNVIFLSPLPRYVNNSCCDREDHAPNRRESNFEETFQRSVADLRATSKIFCLQAG